MYLKRFLPAYMRLWLGGLHMEKYQELNEEQLNMLINICYLFKDRSDAIPLILNQIAVLKAEYNHTILEELREVV